MASGTPPPTRNSIHGRFCTVEPFSVEQHASHLFQAFCEDMENRIWTYLPYGPFSNEDDFTNWALKTCLLDDPQFYAITEGQSGRALGLASFLRIDPMNGDIEIGHLNFSPRLQRTTAATEAMYLMMRHIFLELGYRRYEWKCDALNATSRRAAERLGFNFDGIFRQATIYKGRNRDTAWYSILDKDWLSLNMAFANWLNDNNFYSNGWQKTPLSEFLDQHRSSRQNH